MKTKQEKLIDTLKLSRDCLSDLVHCIRDFQLGDYSPLMDEIFEAEHAISEADKVLGKRKKRRS
jgi:hypothetical protein